MGRNADTSSRFIIGPDRIATAFQDVDGAGGIEVEFSGGRKVKTYEVWASDRLADWAVLKQHIPPLPTGDPAAVAIGDRLILFDVEGGRARMLGGVDFAGRDQQAPFGERLRITPSPFPESMGGPLFDPMGRVIGIVGGSIAPGARSSRMDSFVSPGLWTRFDARCGADYRTTVESRIGGHVGDAH